MMAAGGALTRGRVGMGRGRVSSMEYRVWGMSIISGGSPRWRVGLGRAAIAIAAVRIRRWESRRILAKRVEVVRQIANGRDGNHVPTSGSQVASPTRPYLRVAGWDGWGIREP